MKLYNKNDNNKIQCKKQVIIRKIDCRCLFMEKLTTYGSLARTQIQCKNHVTANNLNFKRKEIMN